jgi:hypothetical protein
MIEVNIYLILITLIIGWILYKCWLSKLELGKVTENFSPAPTCTLDLNVKDKKTYKNYVDWFKNTYPCNNKHQIIGYDNPYIYPYSYGDMNLNHPVGKFKYPGWVRQTVLDENNQLGFPGFIY